MSGQLRGTSVVVPTLNEAKTVAGVLRGIVEALRSSGISFEIMVVDDSSPDGTAALAREAAVDLHAPIRVLERKVPNPSLSTAVLLGATNARYSVVCVLDADGSHDPSLIPQLAGRVLEGTAEIAIGSRYVLGGGASRWPLGRRVLSLVASAPARALTGVRDPMSGFFACSREDLLDFGAKARGYKILFELLMRSPRGARVTEVPLEFVGRTQGSSKLGLKVVRDYLIQLLRLSLNPAVWRARPKPSMR